MKTASRLTRYRASHLGAILEAQGRRKDWVAAEAGISPALVALLLSGERTASEEVAGRVARALGVPLFLAFDRLHRHDLVPTSSENAA